MHSLEEILSAIAQYGSVRKAAIALSVSPQAISKRFKALSDESPIKQRYDALLGKKGRPKTSLLTRAEQVRVAVRAHRAKSNQGQ